VDAANGKELRRSGHCLVAVVLAAVV